MGSSKTAVAGRRNGRRTGLKNPLLAISGRHLPSLATRVNPLCFNILCNYLAGFPRLPENEVPTMKLAQNLAQTRR
jgi:hypothetical protein